MKSATLGSAASFRIVIPCVFCGVGLGPRQYMTPDRHVVTVYPGCVCDACYDALYPTRETSAKARREAAAP